MTLVGDHRRPRGGPRTLTAASAQVQAKRGQVAVPNRMRVEDAELWRHYREIGVVHYGIGFKRSNATRARFLPARVGEPGNDPEPIDPDDAAGRDVLDVFEELDGGGGRIAEAVGDAMVHLDVTGVAWPVYQVRAGESRLTVFGTEEVSQLGSRIRLTADTVTAGAWPINTDGSDEEDGDLLAVVWRPSPHDHSVPDSPLRSVVAECELLTSVRLAMRAGYLSRVPAGIITVPSELNPFAPNPEGPDPLLEDMMTALTAAIRDPGSAAAVAPYLLSGPGDVTDKVRHLDIGRRVYPEDIELEAALTRQIATGLDIPAELFSLGDLNHWGAWLVDASAYRAHLDPTLRLALDGITRRIFRPLLQRRLGWSEEQAEKFTLWRDISDLVASPNRVADAVALFDRGILAAAPVRRVAGYDESDAPGGDETPGPTPVPEPPRQVEPGPPNSDQPGAATLTAASTPTLSGAGLADIDRTLLVRLSEASRQAIRHALDRAGARARNRLRGAADLRLVTDGWPNRDVCARLGRQTVTERLALSETDLVTLDDFRDFEADAQRMLDRAVASSATESARLGGVVSRDEGEEADSVDRAVAALVAAAHARTVALLFTPDADPDPAESGEVAEPGALDPATIMDAVTVAGGGAGAAVALGALLEVGVGNGRRVTDWLRNGGIVTVGNRWVYGDRSLRATNFEPHLALDGLEFTSWEDPRLAVGGSFPRVSHYRPQDHRGCLCGHERILTRTGFGG